MATSDGGPGAARRPWWAYLESRKNIAGMAGGVVGLVLALTGAAGALWPLAVAGLYAAGALIAPPERPPAPGFTDPAEQLDALRADFETLYEYLGSVDLPDAPTRELTALTDVLAALLERGWVAEALADDPEGLHKVARAIRGDIPEAVDAYVRTRWWDRLGPGTQSPERALSHHLSLIHQDVRKVGEALAEEQRRRQDIIGIDLESRREQG
ncbi:hypothetical protein [Streptomyces sp. NPDC050560]|uniref:hypothetical protein n=1 Tax=Streptomyces sp. NPDC050560 TaxID=3365630 RepID=UPI0037B24037